MGTPLHFKTKEQIQYRNAVLQFGNLLVYRVVRPWLYWNPAFVFTPTYWKQMKVANLLRKFSWRVIEERKKTFTGGVFKNIDDAAFISKRRLAMLDLLLSAKEDGLGIDDDGIHEEVDTFMFEVNE